MKNFVASREKVCYSLGEEIDKQREEALNYYEDDYQVEAEVFAFKAYRAYDDFEDMPLHGTFLIDGEGLIRWHDISYEPFLEPDFLLDEAKRILK